MTTKDAAKAAGVSATVIKRWIAEGRIAATLDARAYDVDWGSLSEYLASPRKGRGERGADKGPRKAYERRKVKA